MSRKDPRRAIALALPPDLWRAIQVRRRSSRGRRVMDTVRRLVEEGLLVEPMIKRDVTLPDGPVRALQLPSKARQKVADLAQRWGLDQAQVICVLVMTALAEENRTGVLSNP